MNLRKYIVRPGRSLRLPDGTVWASGGDCIEVDMGHEWGQRVMVPQMNRVVPAGDDAPDVTPLPEHIASALKQRGYGAPVDRAISADERKTKSAKPSTKKSKAEPAKEKLADPEE